MLKDIESTWAQLLHALFSRHLTLCHQPVKLILFLLSLGHLDFVLFVEHTKLVLGVITVYIINLILPRLAADSITLAFRPHSCSSFVRILLRLGHRAELRALFLLIVDEGGFLLGCLFFSKLSFVS